MSDFQESGVMEMAGPPQSPGRAATTNPSPDSQGLDNFYVFFSHGTSLRAETPSGWHRPN